MTTKQTKNKTAILYIRMPTTEHETIHALAATEKRSAASMVRILLDEAIAARSKR